MSFEKIIIPSRKVDTGERFRNAGEGVPLVDDSATCLPQAMGGKILGGYVGCDVFPEEVMENDGSYYLYDSTAFGGDGTYNFLSRDVKSHQ